MSSRLHRPTAPLNGGGRRWRLRDQQSFLNTTARRACHPAPVPGESASISGTSECISYYTSLPAQDLLPTYHNQGQVHFYSPLPKKRINRYHNDNDDGHYSMVVTGAFTSNVICARSMNLEARIEKRKKTALPEQNPKKRRHHKFIWWSFGARRLEWSLCSLRTPIIHLYRCRTQGWINDSRGGGGGLGLRGPRGKGSPSVLKGPKPPILTTIAIAEKQPKRSKKGPFSLYICPPPRSHPGNGINGARRGRSLPVPPPCFSSHGRTIPLCRTRAATGPSAPGRVGASSQTTPRTAYALSPTRGSGCLVRPRG